MGCLLVLVVCSHSYFSFFLCSCFLWHCYHVDSSLWLACAQGCCSVTRQNNFSVRQENQAEWWSNFHGEFDRRLDFILLLYSSVLSPTVAHVMIDSPRCVVEPTCVFGAMVFPILGSRIWVCSVSCKFLLQSQSQILQRHFDKK